PARRFDGPLPLGAPRPPSQLPLRLRSRGSPRGAARPPLLAPRARACPHRRRRPVAAARGRRRLRAPRPCPPPVRLPPPRLALPADERARRGNGCPSREPEDRPTDLRRPRLGERRASPRHDPPPGIERPGNSSVLGESGERPLLALAARRPAPTRRETAGDKRP